MTRQLANGEKRSISSKCAEMDREVTRAIGIHLYLTVLQRLVVILSHAANFGSKLCEI